MFTLSEAADNPFNFCVRLIKISVLYLYPVVSSGFFVCFSWRGYSSPTRAPHWPQVSVSGSRQTRPLFYPVRRLHHVCRVDAEEDVQDFRPLRPGLDPSEIIVLILCLERAFHRSRHHSGKFHHYIVQQLIVCQWACRIYYHDAEYRVANLMFSYSISFWQPSPVFIFRNIRSTFPSGVKNDLRPSFGLRLFLTSPKFSAIPWRGSNFFILPNSLFSKVE